MRGVEEGLVHEVLKRTIESDHVESPIRVRQAKQHSVLCWMMI